MRMHDVRFQIVAFLVITMGLPFGPPQVRAQIAAPSKSPFDPPGRKVVIDLGPSEFYLPNLHVHSTLTCWYYPHFLVKELDFRQKGAEWDSIVPMNAAGMPKCEQAKNESEIRLDQKDWDGYFSGVVGDSVFFDAADGLNGSLAFRVVDAASGKQIFEDVWEGERLRIERQPNGPPVLTYTRGYFADCPLPKGGATCWKKIRAATGLQQSTAPLCPNPFKDLDDPSVVFYPIRVELGPKPERTLIPGRIRCQARD